VTVNVPMPGALWVVVAVTATGEATTTLHASRNAASKASRRCRDRGLSSRVWHLAEGAEWLSLAASDEVFQTGRRRPPVHWTRRRERAAS
jgi:hypothetical protein